MVPPHVRVTRRRCDFRRRVIDDLGVGPSDETLDLRRELLGDRQGVDRLLSLRQCDSAQTLLVGRTRGWGPV